MSPTIYIPLAFLGGVLPALFWLWFWLHEDNLHPEPRRRLMLCFLAGMVVVPLVFPFEKVILDYFGSTSNLTFFFWAVVEEVFKFGAAYFAALSLRDNDEPIDSIIYMITAALGFSALENTFFLISSLNGDTLGSALVTGNLRFIGATLLHTASSATVGIFMALQYYKPRLILRFSTIIGLALAVILHTLFNLSIINSNGRETIATFYVVWISIIVMILMFEKVKHIRKPFA